PVRRLGPAGRGRSLGQPLWRHQPPFRRGVSTSRSPRNAASRQDGKHGPCDDIQARIVRCRGGWCIGHGGGRATSLHVLRSLAMRVLAIGVALMLLLVGSTAASAQGPVATFDWRMPDRFGPLLPTGIVDYHWASSKAEYDAKFVRPQAWRVEFDACRSRGVT